MKKTKRNNTPIIVGILIILAIAAGIWYVTQQEKQNVDDIKNLNITLAELTFKEATLTEAQLTLSVNIHNPNPRTVTVDTFTAHVSTNGKPITTFELDKQLIIPAEEDVIHHFTVSLNYAEVGSALINVILQQRADWNVTGVYNFEVLGVTKEVPFTLP